MRGSALALGVLLTSVCMSKTRMASLTTCLAAALTLAGCSESPTRGAEPESKNTASTGSGALPNALNCPNLNEVDLRPLLSVVSESDTSESSDMCGWSGVPTQASDGGVGSDYLSVRVSPGFPATYEDADAAFGIAEEVEANSFIATSLEPEGWSYGVQLTGSVDGILPDSTATLAYYFVEEGGKGMSCIYHPYLTDDALTEGDPDEPQDAFLTEKQPVVLDMCTQLLAKTRE